MNRANAPVKKERGQEGEKLEREKEKEREIKRKIREGSIEAWQGRRESECWNDGWKRMADDDDDDVFQRFPPLDTFGSRWKS